eukprot:m.1033845 g.1033845  ORF g.1033845 m.1033845 type:complete len:50 (+) comp24134_c0_seq1:47-196(+)
MEDADNVANTIADAIRVNRQDIVRAIVERTVALPDGGASLRMFCYSMTI